jgi:TatD DNase family protein
MINSHIHLDFTHLPTIDEAQIPIVPSIGKQNWAAVQDFPYFALGVHPWMLPAHKIQDLTELEYLIKCNNPIAIGECGLDFTKDIDFSYQVDFFQAQLKLASIYQLPVIVHAVKATEQTILSLKKYPKVRGVIHAFSGSKSQANTLIKMGFYLGFGTRIIDQKNSKIRALITHIPLENILLETDDDNPNNLPIIAQTLADLKKNSLEETIQQCDNNALLLFKLN